MLEKTYAFSIGNEKNIEKMIDDNDVVVNHIVLPKGAALPEHYSNSNVYLIIVRGQMTLKLAEEECHQYQYGQVVNIPYHVKMSIINFNEDVLEFFVVKAPNPKNYQA